MTKLPQHLSEGRHEPTDCSDHQYSVIDLHDHNHEDSHSHPHEELYGEVSEVPAVFSHSFLINFVQEISGEELDNRLIGWIDLLQQWLHQNKYLIGHIKVFIENEGNFNLWLSTTGSKINIQGSTQWQVSRVKSCTIHMTAIAFGITEAVLQKQTLENLEKSISLSALS